MWNIGNRLRVQRDIFTDLAGAACCGRNQLAILIAKAEREAVDLWLCRDDKPVCRSFSKQPANALQKFLDIFGAERVLEAEHWQGVDEFAEGRRQVGADLLNGSVARGQLRIDIFYLVMTPNQRVESVVADIRVLFSVIMPVVALYFMAERYNLTS